MSDENRHKINKQILELDMPSSTGSHRSLHSVAQHLKVNTLPDIEALFDRLVEPGKTIKLDRIEVNLGEIASSNWLQKFESRLVVELTNVLEQVLTNNADLSTPTNPVQDKLALLLYFLRNGRLPAKTKQFPDIWSHEFLQSLDVKQWQALQSELAQNHHTRLRLIHTFEDKVLATIVENITELPDVQHVFSAFLPKGISSAKKVNWRTQFWNALLLSVNSSDFNKRGQIYLQRLVKLQSNTASDPANKNLQVNLNEKLVQPWKSWLTTIRDNEEAIKNTKTQESDEPGIHKIKPGDSENLSDIKEYSKEKSGLTNQNELKSRPPENVTASSTEQNASLKPQNESKVASPRSHASVKDEVSEAIRGSLTVSGAGSVILHPFLKELFNSTKLLDGKKFRDEMSQQKAVHMLTHLTWGESAIPEFELLIPKLLCGMAWKEPLVPMELSDEEHAACNEMLAAVLGHWQALKGCSTTWMREQFFLRPATLKQVDKGWQITVERRAQDVLLNRLPWGLSVLSLPWRKEGLIYVRWLD